MSRPAPIALDWAGPRRLPAEAGLLAYTVTRASRCGRVILEAGTPMSDGDRATSYALWLRVPESEVEHTDGGSPYWTRNGDYLAPVGGRHYAHVYDDAGLASAKDTAERVAHEAAP